MSMLIVTFQYIINNHKVTHDKVEFEMQENNSKFVYLIKFQNFNQIQLF